VAIPRQKTPIWDRHGRTAGNYRQADCLRGIRYQQPHSEKLPQNQQAVWHFLWTIM